MSENNLSELAQTTSSVESPCYMAQIRDFIRVESKISSSISLERDIDKYTEIVNIHISDAGIWIMAYSQNPPRLLLVKDQNVFKIPDKELILNKDRHKNILVYIKNGHPFISRRGYGGETTEQFLQKTMTPFMIARIVLAIATHQIL